VSDDILKLSATELVAAYRSHALSPVEVARAVLDRIAALDPVFNAFCVLDAESALRDARAAEDRWQRNAPAGLVDGVPTTVKDLILAKGWPTRRGSRTIDPAARVWDEDGPPVARMREQGAVLLGKTTTPEFGWKGVTDSPLTGTTVNPWNTELTPGGSSGGAAVCAALNMGFLHLATDGGGSIRIPAAFCGIFGFKPTWGIVPVHPHSPAGTLWHQGPLARNVGDAALVLEVISRPDPRDWSSVPHATAWRSGLDDGIAGWRIGYSRTLGYANVDPAVAAAVEKSLRTFEDLGARVEAIDLPLADPIEMMQPLWSLALSMAIAPLDPARRALVDPPLLALAEPGFSMGALEYRRVESAREAFGRRMNALHDTYDLLVTPQMPITAFAAGHEVPPDGSRKRWWEWSPFTYPFNLTQQPAATVPCGFVDGLPVALQLVGPKFGDARVLRAARAFESAAPFRMPAIPQRAGAAPARKIPVKEK
jgi:aspartyl-tRNA(Asn)/glutamyl-tRNA(Gln) amidotransferase subunit A